MKIKQMLQFAIYERVVIHTPLDEHTILVPLSCDLFNINYNRGNFVLDTSHPLILHTFVFTGHNHQPVPPPSATPATATLQSHHHHHHRPQIYNILRPPPSTHHQQQCCCFQQRRRPTSIAYLLPTGVATFTYPSKSAFLCLCFSRSAFFKGS